MSGHQGKICFGACSEDIVLDFIYYRYLSRYPKIATIDFPIYVRQGWRPLNFFEVKRSSVDVTSCKTAFTSIDVEILYVKGVEFDVSHQKLRGKHAFTAHISKVLVEFLSILKYHNCLIMQSLESHLVSVKHISRSSFQTSKGVSCCWLPVPFADGVAMC